MATTTKTPRYRFGVDADNVLFDSWGHALDRLNASKNFSPKLLRDETTVRPFHLSPVFAAAFAARGVTVDDAKKEVSLQIDRTWREFHQELQLMDPNIPKVIAALQSKGVSIEIITTMGARDPEIHPNMYKALDRTGVPYDTVSFVKDSTQKVAYPVQTIVDDEQSLAIDLAKTKRPGLVYDAPWNREFAATLKTDPNAEKLIIPVKDWTETGQTVLKLMEARESVTMKA